MLELADETDSKSVGGNTVWVRAPPPAPVEAGSLAAGQTTTVELQENLGGAFAAAGEATIAGAGETAADTALMAGGIAAVISLVVISMLIVAGVTAGTL